MRRLQQVSNINIINTKLITVTDIDSMSLHTGDRGNDKFWPFEWKEQKIVSYIIRFDWFCSTCLFINRVILWEFFFLKCSFILQSKLLSNLVPDQSCRFVDLYRRKPIRRLALAYWPWDTHWFCFYEYVLLSMKEINSHAVIDRCVRRHYNTSGEISFTKLWRSQ